MPEYKEPTPPNIKSLKKKFSGNDVAPPTIEFAPETNAKINEALVNHVTKTYEESVEYYDRYKDEWDANRMAYMARPADQFNYAATISDGNGNLSTYCSAILADKVEDIVAIQLTGRPTVYPLPHVNDEFNFAQVLKEEETPDIYVRNVWTFCFKDLQERRGMQQLNIKMCIDARLYGFTTCKITQKYDFDIHQDDVFFEVCAPGTVLFDPDAKSVSECRYIYHRQWKQPYELLMEYPDYKEEVLAAMGGNPSILSVYDSDEQFKKKNLVCIVEGYIRDLTQEKVEMQIEIIGEDGNVTYENATETRYKYPNGRRITFLEKDKGICVLSDEPNPYNKLPYEVFVSKPISWALIGRNESSPLRALQMMDDYVLQQMTANMKKFGGGVLLHDKKSLIDPEKIRGLVGEIIGLDIMGGVQFEISKNICQDALIAHEIIQGAANNISGLEAAQEGRAPGSVTSGVGISLLQESGNRKISPSSDCYAEFLQRVWKQAADIMIDLYKAGRPLRVSDLDGIAVELDADLYAITNSIDVAVDSYTALAMDPVSMANFSLSLLQAKDENGLPIIDRKVLAEWVKVPGFRDAMIRVIKMSEQRRQEDLQMQEMQAMAGKQGQGENAPQPNAGADMGMPGQMNPTNMMQGLEDAQPGIPTLTPDQLAMLGG